MNRESISLLLLTALSGIVSAATAPAPANIYIQHNLVADLRGVADVTDPNLVNPWGISESASSPFWISDNGKGLTTLYNGSGTIIPLVVTVAPPNGQSGASAPSGQVNNNTTVFLLANGKPASFIFVTEDGTVSAWNGGSATTIEVDNSASGAIYKGVALGANASGPQLYAANFNAGTVDVFNGTFASTKVAGGFADANIPAGFAPFNIANLNGKLYVSYAKQDAQKNDDVAGPGNGFVDIFDMDGNLQTRLISNGPLNSPWGMAIAPSTFGPFGGALLVGDFGDGKINAFDASAGTLLGTLQNSQGVAISIDGLWAIIFGNGKTGGDKNTLYFTSGPNQEQHGLFGSLAPPAAISGILNSASNLSGPIAPGEAVTLTGGTIGPSPLASAKIPSSGTLGTSLSGAGVTFNGTLAPIIYTSASQTAVLVPYAIAGSSTANVVVTYQNQTTASFQVPVAASAPGTFTLDSSGGGAAVVFNQDGSLNSATNAASAGSVVALFGTGEGMTEPAGQDGLVENDVFRTSVAPVTATIGGKAAQVTYAGSAPGQLSGVMQVEAVVPSGAGTGAVPVVLTIGSASSQTNATIYLQ
ncbi:MAG: TIGR03118 family protein [Bryobacteraceae bacterium]|jgi:uncharacterized protein (TIGR03118 family)